MKSFSLVFIMLFADNQSMENLCKYQMEILAKLMMEHEARFTDLNTHQLPSDQFSYHINKLISLGLIVKNSSDKYIFTDEGISFVTRLEHATATIEKQPLVVVMAICVRNIERGEEYLIQKRTKQPDIDFYTFPSGKARFGLTLKENILRELEEEAGVTGIPTLKEVSHILKYRGEKSNIVRDLVIYTYRIDDVVGTPITSDEGEHTWMTLAEYKSLDKTYSTNLRAIELVNNEGTAITEDCIEIEK